MIVIDTNILVYVTDRSAAKTDRATDALRRVGQQSGIAVTRQIIREYLAVMTRPQPTRAPFGLREAWSAVDRLTRHVEVLDDGPHVWSELEALSMRFLFGGKQVHDANIVATMLAHGKTRILTFNHADFRRFEPLIEIIEP